MIRRILVLFLGFLLIASLGVVAFAADNTYSVLLPYANYSFDWNLTDDYSFSSMFDCAGIDPSESVTITIWSDVYTGFWLFSENKQLWYFGDLSTDSPFCVTYKAGQICVYLAGGHSASPGVPLELYQGQRPPAGSAVGDSIADKSITSSLRYVVSWFTTFWIQLMYGSLSPLVPVFALAVAVPLVLVVIRFILRSL